MKKQELRLEGLDREIRSLASLLKRHELIIDGLFDRISNRSLTIDEQKLVTPLFWLGGSPMKLLEVFKDHLSYQQPIAWGYLVETLNICGFTFDEAIANKIYSEAQSHNLLNELALTNKLDTWLPELANIRSSLQRDSDLEFLKKKSNLLQQADMFKTQDMEEQELEVLKYLALLDPTDSLVNSKILDLNQRRSKKLLEQKSLNVFLSPQVKISDLDPEDLSLKQELVNSILDRVKVHSTNPDLIYQYAIALTQIELHHEALGILDHINPLSLSQAWLKLYLLKGTEQFLPALEFLDTFDSFQGEETSTTPAVQYERALVYWHLNQTSKALGLLEDLILIHPEFRDASTLIRQWRHSLGS